MNLVEIKIDIFYFYGAICSSSPTSNHSLLSNKKKMVHEAITYYRGAIIIATVKELVENGLVVHECDCCDKFENLGDIPANEICDMMNKLFDPFNLAVATFQCCHAKNDDGKMLFVVYEKGKEMKCYYSFAAACRCNKEWMTEKKLENSGSLSGCFSRSTKGSFLKSKGDVALTEAAVSWPQYWP